MYVNQKMDRTPNAYFFMFMCEGWHSMLQTRVEFGLSWTVLKTFPFQHQFQNSFFSLFTAGYFSGNPNPNQYNLILIFQDHNNILYGNYNLKKTTKWHMDERAACGSGATGPALGTNHVILIPPVTP